MSYDEASHQLTIASPFFQERKPEKGASIAIDGICLTACHFFPQDPERIGFDLGIETRNVSLLTKKQAGDMVNIEFSLRAGDPIDGHMVQGHVDGIAEILSITEKESGFIFNLSLPSSLAHLVAMKGSIAINGISLTVNEVTSNSFSVCIVPYTMDNTSLANNKVGDRVHIETDLIGRHLARLYTNIDHPRLQ